MPITNFEFPGVTLRQVYDETPTSTVRTLGVACVGTVYKTHNANSPVKGEAVQIPAQDWTITGNTTYSLVPTEDGTLDTNAAAMHLVVKNGVYAYAAEQSLDESDMSVSDGTITFDYAVAGKDVEAATFGTRGVMVGDPIVLYGDGGQVVANILAISADNKTIYVGSANLSKALGSSGTALTKVYFCELADKRYEPGAGTFNISDYLVTIYSQVATLGSSGLRILLSDLGLNASLIAGDVYVEYREKIDTYNNTRGSVGTLNDVLETLGYPCKDNPMALACYAAVAAGNNAVVSFTGVDSESPAAYTEALDLLARYDDIYSIVPVTTDADIIQQCLTSCKTFSEDEESTIRRVLWYGIDTNAALSTKEDKVQDLIAQRMARSTDMRGVCVWADNIQYGGEVVPNYVGAAAAAGMRSYEPCQRPLSNLGYSFFTVKEDTGFTKTHLKELGANGIWIIANNSDGLPVNMRQLTTAVSNNLNKDEESIVANVDTVAMAMSQIGRNLVGCSNITSELLLELQNSLVHLFDRYKINDTGSAYIGPQLLDYEILRVYQDPVNLDHIYAEVTITPPKPFNRFVMTVRVI